MPFATGGAAPYFVRMSETHDLTRNQHLVLDALTQATGPLSAYGILDQVRSDGIKAPLQIEAGAQVGIPSPVRAQPVQPVVKACKAESCLILEACTIYRCTWRML